MIIAIANQKGGVGKTTTAVTLSDLFARAKHHVLLVDLDGQGNVADSLGLEPGRELTRLIAPDIADPLRDCLVTSGRPNLEIIRADKSTVSLKSSLAGAMLREMALQRALESSLHDYIFLDCAPSADLLHIAAIVAADWLLVPTRLDQLAVKGVRDVLTTLKELHDLGVSKCRFAGVIPTFYERTTNESQAQLKHLVETFKHYVFPPIPVDTQCREASRKGQTLAEYAPSCRALMGVLNGGGNYVGGYNQVFERFEKMLHG